MEVSTRLTLTLLIAAAACGAVLVLLTKDELADPSIPAPRPERARAAGDEQFAVPVVSPRVSPSVVAVDADPTKAVKPTRAVTEPPKQKLTRLEETQLWRTEFLDRGTPSERKIHLLRLLRHGEMTDGSDPRDAEVIAEALWLLDQPIEGERREDVIGGLRGLSEESILLKATDLLRNDSNPEIRGDAAKLLGEMDNERAIAALKWSAENDAAERVRSDCLEALR
ncbi:HEAT repeat domain-containing protein [Planctomycetes bacterium Poly30]